MRNKCGALQGITNTFDNLFNVELCQSPATAPSCSADVVTGAGKNIRLDAFTPTDSFGQQSGTLYPNPVDCCEACRANPSCNAWNSLNVGPFFLCYFITSTECAGKQTVRRIDTGTTGLTISGIGGAGAQARCQNAGTSTGCLDPHFVIQASSSLASQVFTFDFHGLASKVYCMVSDIALQLNVAMFGIPPTSRVIERKSDLGDDFFTGTWMDAIGFVYIRSTGARENLTIELDHDKARTGAFPFRVAHNGKNLTGALVTQEGAVWSSEDGVVTISRASDSVARLGVNIKGVLNMFVSSEIEEEIIVDPPIFFLNFQLKDITTTPFVHGFLGQMYVAGAMEERLAMGTLEGFRQREYVEGADEEYETSGLTATDCNFSRFGHVYANATDHKSSNGSRRSIIGRRLLNHMPSDMRIASRAPLSGCRLLKKDRFGPISISCETNGL